MLQTQPERVSQVVPPKTALAKTPFIDFEGIAMIWLRDMNRLWRQRSRLYGAIARALVQNPSILIADEPCSRLSVCAGFWLAAFICTCRRSQLRAIRLSWRNCDDDHL